MSVPVLTCEILSQGDEVVTGQIADTNAAWLSEQLTELGFLVLRHTAVGDRMDDLVAAFHEIGGRCDLCVCTGGLGPTDDDLTAGAVATAFDRPQELDPVALAQIEDRFRQLGRVMAPVNRRQAMIPRGADRLDNDWGTAPGFGFDGGRAWFACMPGVPREMRAMFAERVVPRLRSRFTLAPGRLVTLRTVGVGESDLQQALGDWSAPGVVVGFRTKLPENHLKLRFSADVPPAELSALVTAVLGRVGRWVYTVEGLPEPIEGYDCTGGAQAEVVGRMLAARGQTLALAESCTGGRIAAACTAVPGASEWLLEGIVSYANAAKVRLLGVSESDLAEHGAVSELVARAMAAGVRARSGASWGVGVTGIAGPGGGTPDKPVGTVHVALEGPEGQVHRAFRWMGNRPPGAATAADRDRIQQLTVAAALEMLRSSIVRQVPPNPIDRRAPVPPEQLRGGETTPT
ncbi:MAG: CinA family nicotinamide mononucleotide deamidase-related protein, partial [Myxococcota bacterium]